MGDSNKKKKIEKILNSLSQNERKILPHLESRKLSEICKKANLDRVSTLRALEYLENKGIIRVLTKNKKVVELGVNGILYRKKGLPERRLLNLLNEKRIIKFQEAQKEAGLSDDEFKASLGVLKRKNFIELKKENIIFNFNKEEIHKKSSEEIFIELLPIDYEFLNQEQIQVLKELWKRKDIIEIKEEKIIEIEPTDFGKEIIKMGAGRKDLIERITPEILKNSSWRGKGFRRYDLEISIPKVYGGKRHFVAQAADYARTLWLEMGFKEMSGNLIVSSFWNFDALFTAQDHPVREMQDTFFLNQKEEIDKEFLKKVKKSHEEGVSGSVGWRYKWNEEEAKKLVLRTHTTCLSAQTLAKIKIQDLPQKFFAIGKCFRNETLDWNHGFEFNQTEGIVVDKNANFVHLLGYLKEFFKKMGFEKARFRPGYFPYTEPSVEIDVWNPEKKVWFELGGAGILRPEVVVPLLGEPVPVLAWGPGLDRMLMDYYEIKDLREFYKNDINQLRRIKFWVK